MSNHDLRPRDVVGRAIADGMGVAAAKAALEAGELDGAPATRVTTDDALKAAWEAREEDLLREGLALRDDVRQVRAVVRRDLDALQQRTAGQVALSLDETNRLGRLLVLQERIGKVLKAAPGRGHRRTARIADRDAEPAQPSSSATALVDRLTPEEPTGTSSGLAERLARHLEDRDANGERALATANGK